MKSELSTKAGIFEKGTKDAFGAEYNDCRLLRCQNKALTHYEVADGTQVICDRAFYGLGNISSIVLPPSVEAIGEGAFAGCKALVDINIPEGVDAIQTGTFRDCDALVAVELPKSVNKIGQFAFAKGLTTIVINAPAADIHRFAFMNCRNLTTVMVPEGSGAYYKSILAEARIPAEVLEISQDDEGAYCKPNDTEKGEKNNRMKKIKIEYWGKYLELQVCAARDDEGNILSEDDGYIDSLAAKWELDEFNFQIEGKEYAADDFTTEYTPGDEEDAKNSNLPWVFGKDKLPLKFANGINVEEEIKKLSADYALVLYNKDFGSIEIEIPENKEFDPDKVIIYFSDWYCPRGEITVVSGFVYDGKGYELESFGGMGNSSITLWGTNPNDDDDFDDEDYDDEDYDEEDDEEVTSDVVDDYSEMAKNISYKKGENDKYGYIRDDGSWAIKPQFDNAWNFSDGIAQVKVDGKWGYVRADGSWLFQPQFDYTDDFSDGLARVKVDGKYGYIKSDGSWAIEPQFDDARNFSDGVALVEVDDKWGYVRADGSWLFEPQFDDARNFSDGVALVEVDDKWGYVRADGSWAIKPQFDNAWDFSDGLARVKVDGKWGFIRADGTWAIEPQFDYATDFSDGLAEVEVDGKRGLFNKNGDCIVDIVYDEIKDPKNGYSRVSRNGKWGYIRPDGSFLVVPKFNYAWDFEDGKARVNQGLEIGYIDESAVFTPVSVENDPELKELENLISANNAEIDKQLTRTIPYGLVVYSIDPSTANANPKTAVPIWFTWESDSYTHYKIGGTKFFFGDYGFSAFQLVDSYDWFSDDVKGLATCEHPSDHRYTYSLNSLYDGNIDALSELIECYKKGWITRLADIEDENSDGIELQLDPDVDYSEYAQEWEPDDDEEDYDDDEEDYEEDDEDFDDDEDIFDDEDDEDFDDDEDSESESLGKSEDVDVETLEFTVYEVDCDFYQLAAFLGDEERGCGSGYFIAGTNDEKYYKGSSEDNEFLSPSGYNLYLDFFVGCPGEAFLRLNEQDEDRAREILHYGKVMVSLVSDDDDGYDEDTMAALALIAGLNSPDLSTDAPEYNGPEAIYKIILEDQDNERIGTYRYRICKDGDGKWIAEKI